MDSNERRSETNDEYDTHDRGAQANRQDDEQIVGAYRIGSDIISDTDDPARPARGLEGGPASRSDVVGNNAGVQGDADAMTAGATDDPRPDDSAMRDS